MKNKKSGRLFSSNQTTDYDEEESRTLEENRRDDKRNFVRTAKEIISHTGYLTTLS